MAKFIYVIRDPSGKKITGVQEGDNEEDIVARLQESGNIVVEIGLASKENLDILKSEGVKRIKFKKNMHYGVSGIDLVLFCRQLTTLLGAGVTILKSLDTISKQVASHKLYNVIETLKKDMERGLSFHEALSKHPTVFTELWVNLVESGEASGNLAVVLDRLATYLERNAEFRSKIISSLVYPCILLAAAIGALLFLTMKIIPTFAEVFKGFDIEMPLATKMIINVSYLTKKFFPFMVIGTGASVYALSQYIKTKVGRKKYEDILFKLPVFGDFFRAINIERFASEMSTLVESGVPILYSLEIAEQSVGSVIISGIIRKVKEDVRVGKSLSRPLEESGFFEPMVVQMVSIGEEIGELSQMFKRISVFYQEYVETFLARFVAMFEPIILIFMGLVIGMMVIGMFLPIFQLSKVGS